jgi:hypothetical protein
MKVDSVRSRPLAVMKIKCLPGQKTGSRFCPFVNLPQYTRQVGYVSCTILLPLWQSTPYLDLSFPNAMNASS